MTISNFCTTNKFALWIDMRSHFDKDMHGSVMVLNNTHDCVKLEIKRNTGGSGNITCYMFVIADALMELLDSGFLDVRSSRKNSISLYNYRSNKL